MILPKGAEGVHFVDVEGREEIATRALVTDKVYGERIVDGYRVWRPHNSKLAAYLRKGGTFFPFKPGANVLYLGAGSGTTASHVSDLVEKDGVVLCVEFSERTMRELLNTCEKRKNMIPILGDANFPEEYEQYVLGKVDIVYQDVAQPNQAEIFLRNCRKFLKPGGTGFLMVKAPSIDVVVEPIDIYHRVEKELRKELEVLELRLLDPYQKGHAVIVISA